MTLRRDASPTVTSSTPSSDSSGAKRVLFILGTRPEAIKLCPLIEALRRSELPLQAVVCATGQHREMLQQVLGAFSVSLDFDLKVMTGGQTLNHLAGRLLAGLESVFDEVMPAITVVQGDTTTTLCGALASFHRRVPVAHVEAGLRTHDLAAPFPEEGNRILTDRLARLHFAATPWAAENLLQEGIPADDVMVTGNTGIDAVLSVCQSLDRGLLQPRPLPLAVGKRLILVTAHRRENFGNDLDEICGAIALLAKRGDVQIVWPVHLNPQVRDVVYQNLGECSAVTLTEPLDYVSFVHLMRCAYLILTDSGGIQEEAPSLGKPVLVLRAKTERPEAVSAGLVKLVGTSQQTIVDEAAWLLDHPADYGRMARSSNEYGDGRASVRIVERIASYLFPQPDKLP